MHIQKVRNNCKKKVNQLHSVISNRGIVQRLLLLSVVRPSLEYGSEIWYIVISLSPGQELFSSPEQRRFLGVLLKCVMKFGVTWAWKL